MDLIQTQAISMQETSSSPMSDSKVMCVAQAPSSAQAEPEGEMIDTTVKNNCHVDESAESFTDEKRNLHLIANETHQNHLKMDCQMIEP